TEALQFIARALAERISTSLLTYGLGTRALRITLSQETAKPVVIEVRFAYPVTTASELFDGIRPRLLRASISAPLERISLRAGRLAVGDRRAQPLADRLRLVAQPDLARVLALADRRGPRARVLLRSRPGTVVRGARL